MSGGCSEFCRQFGILAWKNATLKTRQVLTLLVELLVPVIIIILIGLLRWVVKPTLTPEIVPNSFDLAPSFDSYYSLPSCVSENLLWSCNNNYPCLPDPSRCQRRSIAIAPSNPGASTVTAVVNFAKWATALETKLNHSTEYQTFMTFQSQSALTDYISSANYLTSGKNLISAAVIFDSGYPSWQYTLRMNQTFHSSRGSSQDLPRTSTPDIDITVKSGNAYVNNGPPYAEAYMVAGQLALGDLVNSFIASTTCKSSGQCIGDDLVMLNTTGIAEFPSPESKDNIFWQIIGGTVFALFMILALLYPIANVIRSLVFEKETKLREGMAMMAMRSDALWAAWSLHNLCLFLPLSLLLTGAGKFLFVQSNSFFVWLYFFTFFMGSVSYCYFIATLFNKSLTAAIIGCLTFLGGWIIFVGMTAGGKLTRGVIIAASLHPACAFSFGTLAFTEYEGAQIGVTRYTWNVSNEYPITFQDSVTMMFIDWIYLGILSWYLAKIWPSEYGTHEPWYFICLPKFWIKTFYSCIGCAGPYSRLDQQGAAEEAVAVPSVPVEEVTADLAAQVANKTCVDIRNLYKAFDTKTGKKVAVDNLNLTMYSGQITALLGHNGAGKTTTIAMLTGLIPADSGSAIIEGYDSNYEMEEIRRNLGVCPQHDVLYPDLTVEEHLKLFASFKGVKGADLNAEVNKMIQSVGLTEKRNSYSKTLSGGQKRKLSVGIAFIGGSRIVFLDEPTSGMDPYSRRFTWSVIRQHREGRVIVLTTHFMDEADLLGDRIAIMGDGKLCCCGSSLFLKRAFGVGYNMTLEKKNALKFNSENMKSVIARRVPDAKLLTDVGTEMTFQLPFSASSAFPTLFEHFDSNLDTLGLQSYGMSVTTLEEVFIKVAHGTTTQATAEKGKIAAVVPDATSTRDVEAAGNATSATVPFSKLPDDDVFAYFARHMSAMLRKRYLYFIRDQRAWIFQYAAPIAFLLIGLLIMRFTSYITPQPKKSLSAHLYNPKIGNNFLPSPYSAASTFCITLGSYDQCLPVGGQSDIMSAFPDAAKDPIIALADAENIYNVSTYLIQNKDKFAASQIGAVSFLANQLTVNGDAPVFVDSVSSLLYVVHANYTAVHAAPLYQALVASAAVNSIDAAASISVNIFPLPLTDKELSVFNSYNANLVATFILIAIPYIPASFTSYVVREREVKSKHVQMVSGVGVPAYWLSMWIWDMTSYQITLWAFVVLVCIFPNTQPLTGIHSGALGAFIALLILFGSSIAGFSYLASYLFSSPAMAQIAMILVIFILGFILSIVGTVLRAIPDTHDQYMHIIRYFLALFPPFALGEALNNLTYITLWSFSELSGTERYHPMDWNIAGMGICFLGWETVAYLGIAIGYEYIMTIPSVQSYLTMNATLPPVTEGKDDDVLAEEARVSSGQADNSTILVKDLKKMYGAGKFAVKGVSLGIPNGECFGLLGINGAGKSTTLAMLSGEFQPTSGEAYLAGLNLLTQVHECRRKIGFCPQFDALFELLTAREHLELYARIKGIAEEDVKRVVDGKIAEMALTEYADRAAGQYSGGNKRKLSVAIAMIGEPSIVFLDEPSTGMDPVNRRFMWEVISDIVTKREKCSLILTTHSMEECEALCTRIGIMVGGVLKCLGSAQRLRSKYGHGYQIEIGMVIPDNAAVLAQCNNIATALGVAVSEQADNQIKAADLGRAFTALGVASWINEVKETGSGSDLQAALDSHGYITIKHLASWLILEASFTKIAQFLTSTFGSYILRERQTSKIRIEVSAFDPSSVPNEPGQRRKLSWMFGAIEARKRELFIQEYSISQTSLEQIFNQFAATQQEETGTAVGIQR